MLKAICLSYHGQPAHIEVTTEMGQTLAKSWETENYHVPFIETSAKSGENVQQAFEELVLLSRRCSNKS